jgi:hypothetical protein
VERFSKRSVTPHRLGPATVIVTLAVDSGFKYLSVPPYGG